MKYPAIMISLMLYPGRATAQAFEDLPALDAQIVSLLEGDSEMKDAVAAPVDRRLKLVRCPQPVRIEPVQMGAIAVRCLPVGWRIRVPVLFKTAPDQFIEKKMVRRGDAVELIITGAGFEISTSAVALDDGILDQTIRVKTLTGKAPVIANVRNTGQVAIVR
jgi:flagellar basal body P-ring formation protein FlgA